MEPVFEYRFTANDAFIKKMYKYLVFKRPPRPVLFAVFGVMGLVIFGIVIAFAVMNILSFPLVSSAIVYALCFLIMILPYFTSVSARRKQIREMYGGNYPEDFIIFDGEALRMGVNGSLTTATPYAQMKSLRENDGALVLETHARLIYFLSKEGFVKGTPEELKVFLASKGVNVKE
ncbi:MAG: hypothetical protein IJU52_08550 [Clostridia bacterium]|nr:hypothetical protein [Clostridia bacterium]